jgi:hypothetical protein
MISGFTLFFLHLLSLLIFIQHKIMSGTKISLPPPTSNATEDIAPTKSHKRQASIGLGIVTHLTESTLIAPRRKSISKNVSFFDMATSFLTQMKPPPSLSISTRHRNHSYPYQQQQQDHQVNVDRPTFADRIRSIVLANRKTAANTSVSGSSNSRNNHTKKNSISKSNASSNNNSSVNLSFPEDQIIPLPSPSQPSLTRTNTFTRHSVVTPTLVAQDEDTLMAEGEIHTPPPSSAIPIISLSPNFSPNKTNIIPPLQEVPMLGDMEDDPEYNCNNGNITREFKFPSPSPTHYNDVDNLIGKHIWKFRIKKLLGVGAFSKVFLAHNMEEGGFFAVKMINKERMYQDLRVKSSIEREVGVLKVNCYTV